jgi:hypothetical protein
LQSPWFWGAGYLCAAQSFWEAPLTKILHPLSKLVAEGWEIISASSPLDSFGQPTHSILMRRDGEHKFLTVRKKLIGKQPEVNEFDV